MFKEKGGLGLGSESALCTNEERLYVVVAWHDC